MIIPEIMIIKGFARSECLSLLCCMKLMTFALLLLLLSFNSCTSEYGECLQEAKKLKQQIAFIEKSNFVSPNENLLYEIEKIEAEIEFLAKVSGNEELFLSEINAEL